MTTGNRAKSNRSPLRHDLTVSHVRLEELKPLGREIRAHTKRQIKKLARSLDQFGFVLPIVIDDANRASFLICLFVWARISRPSWPGSSRDSKGAAIQRLKRFALQSGDKPSNTINRQDPSPCPATRMTRQMEDSYDNRQSR